MKQAVREDTQKTSDFVLVGPLRRGGGVKH